MKNHQIAQKLSQHFAGQSLITTQEITDVLHTYLSGLTTSTISWRISQLKKDKLLYQKGRGLYSFEYKPDYIPTLSLKAKRFYNRVKTLYPGELVLWDTNLLNDICDSSHAKYWMFFALPKEDLDTLFNQMLDLSKKVYLQPDKETINRYVIPQEEAIILTPLVSEMPLNKSTEYLNPSIEGILINAWLEYEQYLQPAGFDIELLFKKAFCKYNVNKNKLLRYAARRDKRKEITELLKSIE